MNKEKRDVTVDGTLWVDKISEKHDHAMKYQAQAVDNLVIPTQRNGHKHDDEKCLMSKKLLYTMLSTLSSSYLIMIPLTNQ